MLTEMSMKVNGKTIKQMARALTLTQTAQDIKATGEMTSSTVSVLRHGQMVLSTKDNTLKAKRTARVSLPSQMVLSTMVILR